MPELPEVETVRRGLAKVWEGRRFIEVACHRAGLRQPFPENFAQRLTGRRVESVGRRAKYLVVTLDGGLVMLGHLGMSGRMVISAKRNSPPGRHDHVVFLTDQGIEVVFTDPRRFGLLTLCAADQLGTTRCSPISAPSRSTRNSLPRCWPPPWPKGHLDQGGAARPDPGGRTGQHLRGRKLYRAKISPLRAAGTLSRRDIAKLVPAIKAVLTESIAVGGSTLRDHMLPDGELGYFQHSFAVYGREAKPVPLFLRPGRNRRYHPHGASGSLHFLLCTAAKVMV